jgi:carbamoyltransferase
VIALGINEDLFDSGVALCDGPKVLFASNEERYTRAKNEGGFPYQALASLFKTTGVRPQDIERVCVAGFMTPPLPVRLVPGAHNWLFNARRSHKESFLRGLLDDVTFYTPISHTSDRSLMRSVVKPLLGHVARRMFAKELRNKPFRFVDHHYAHAASAWHLSGFEEALCITSDGMGDGLSLTVSTCAPFSRTGRPERSTRYPEEVGATPWGGMERLWTASSRDSFGLFFQVLTEALGFLSCRDEGKLTGLAANGDHRRVTEPDPFHMEDGRLVYNGPAFGQRGVRWAKEHYAARYSREDLSAWGQYLLEVHTVEIARHWLQKTGLKQLVLSGGVFANVKLNQRLHELDEVESLFVCPNMGDGGLGHGAICAEHLNPPERVRDVFWGESYSDGEIEPVLQRAGVSYEPCPNGEERVAELLAEGKIVARFQGRMEWGPRALGNRSILVRTTDREVVNRLNGLLKRSDFMPFAPAILDEDVAEYCEHWEAGRHAAQFMTVCFDCTERMRRDHPAVVHTDGTARAQLVEAQSNPGFHRILTEFKRRCGNSVVMNTSFNIHEEPIVRTPEEGVASFMTAGLDYLSIGGFLARGRS